MNHSPRPGTELKRILSWFAITADPKCLCHARAHMMDVLGVRWSRQNIDLIVDWIEEEYHSRIDETATLKQQLKQERDADKAEKIKERIKRLGVDQGLVTKGVAMVTRKGGLVPFRTIATIIVKMAISRAERDKR